MYFLNIDSDFKLAYNIILFMFSGAPNNIAVRHGLTDPYIIMGKDVDIEQVPYQVNPLS